MHKRIQTQIAATCRRLGYATTEEHRGDGWRADVFADRGSDAVAFEVQLSNQSLARTLERQDHYSREGIRCCWLFQRPPHKLSSERPDLPLFTVIEAPADSYHVSLSNRNEVPIELFVEQFLEGGIRFCRTARTHPDQNITLVFYEVLCWKCNAINHPYFIDGALRASCNAEIQPDEDLWESNRLGHRPEIIAAAKRFLTSPQGNCLRLGEIKPRYSKTVRKTYRSFGCHSCDSIFGDWFVMNAELDAMNGDGQVDRFDTAVRIEPSIVLPLPHWCYPAGREFCDESGA